MLYIVVLLTFLLSSTLETCIKVFTDKYSLVVINIGINWCCSLAFHYSYHVSLT